MYKTSKEIQERKDAKRQFILGTAVKVFSKRGYHNTAVKDIVEEASISVGSFYFYFKSKEELFTELYLNITKEFQKIENKVLDVEHFPLAKNFTRVIMATLWMYDRNRDMAKIMLMEAAGINPEFQKIRMKSIMESCQVMEGWFKRFKVHHLVNIPDERKAALIFEGSFYYLINDWLESHSSIQLTDSGYALCIYTLQALKISFDEEEIRWYIKEVLDELCEK